MDNLDKIGKLYAIKNDSYTANMGKHNFNLGEIVLYLKRERSTCRSRHFNYYFLTSNSNIVVTYNCSEEHLELLTRPI